MKQFTPTHILFCVMLLTVCLDSQAADWRDTWIGYRYGSQFREPANNSHIAKNIFQLQHASGYKYGSNFLNIDLLQSDANDPASGGRRGAQEVFVVYRHTLSMSGISGKDFHFGVVRDLGVQFGFDWNTKNDAFAARVRRPMIGPNISFDVPGFWNLGLLWQAESNHNGIAGRSVTFDNTWRLATAWKIPFGSEAVPVKFQGFMNYIAPKGKDGFGAQTKAETLLEAAVMFDISPAVADKKGVVYAGVGYQFWKNKFGGNSTADLTGGSSASVPQLQLEWHL